MDHARHLSSPSPTSSFLFHHSERHFKSSLLTPSLLSSASDVNSADDCFSIASSTTATAHQQNHLQDGLTTSPFDGDNQDDVRNRILVSDGSENHHVHQLNEVNQNAEHEHHHQQDHLTGDHDSLTGVDHDVDDDDGMRNMLSGSSRSSTTTMPLLSDAHSDHPFSRISLGGYSPLSLVDDCDNALTISPTSLACGSHHSYKSSLNNLKLDNLDSVDVGVNDHVDDVVGDARSMSPSLMSATTSAIQNHLWSNSSTAITQNPALLTSSSTSFLLSHHHHHHQLNTLMQQLDPPPLINQTAFYESDQLDHHRPSSEPPPGCCQSELIIDESNKIETKSMTSQQSASSSSSSSGQAKLKTQKKHNGGSKSKYIAPVATCSNRSPRKSRAKTTNNVVGKSSSSKMQMVDGGKNEPRAGTSLQSDGTSYCSSKVHLQLNHHLKLKELQERLFGNSSPEKVSSKGQITSADQALVKIENGSEDRSDSSQSKAHTSTGTSQSSLTETQSVPQESSIIATKIEAPSTEQASTQTASTNTETKSNKSRPRFRQTPRRRLKSTKVQSTASTSAPNSATQKLVATESVEPDTTTKISECVKLADLLSTTNSIETNANNNQTFTLSTQSGQSDSSDPSKQYGNTEKKIQNIQLQVSPTFKLMANGGLVQSLGLQQQQLANNVSVVASGCGPVDNQVICGPVTVMASMNANGNSPVTSEQLKCSIVSSGEWLRGADAALISNWSNANQSTNGCDNGITMPHNQTVGAHQIAIQVICQDGTSFVLPVSSATNLSNGVSVTAHNQSQHITTTNQQHVQRIIGPNAPLVSVANILAQQQTTSSTTSSDTNGLSQAIAPTQLSQSGSGSSSSQASGLAASSPTLAALLDAGSNRGSNASDPNHSVVPNSLLRKLVGLNTSGNVDQSRSEVNLNPGAQISLTNNGSLVTICTTNAGPNTLINSNVRLNPGISCIGDKRIKLENVTEVDGNIQTTFTLIEPQGMIVANGNEAPKLIHAEQTKQTDLDQTKSSNCTTTMSDGSLTTLRHQLNMTTSKINSDPSAGPNKQNKITSSTGNRQVDPTQPFRCEHCNSTFTRLGNFTRHKKIHSAPTKDGQRFKCDVCSKSFLQRCDLARHLHIHRGTEPHRCNICGKGYIRHSDLVTHQRFHNKEKPFGCPHCSKGFCQRGDLNRHLRSIHLQMKPILCPCCNRKFAKQETLLRHLNTSHRS